MACGVSWSAVYQMSIVLFSAVFTGCALRVGPRSLTVEPAAKASASEVAPCRYSPAKMPAVLLAACFGVLSRPLNEPCNPPAEVQIQAMLGETQNQFSLTRAALSTGGRAKSKFLSLCLSKEIA